MSRQSNSVEELNENLDLVLRENHPGEANNLTSRFSTVRKTKPFPNFASEMNTFLLNCKEEETSNDTLEHTDNREETGALVVNPLIHEHFSQRLETLTSNRTEP